MKALSGLFGGGAKGKSPLAGNLVNFGTHKVTGKNINFSPSSSGAFKLTPEMAEIASGLIAQTPVPELEKIDPELYEYIGDYNPNALQDSLMSGVSSDKGTLDVQQKALQGLVDTYSQGGMTAIDKAQLADIMADQQAVDKGQREAIIMSQAQRGMGSSGNTLAALLQGQQGSANQANRQALDVASNAQQRALQAMAQSGELSGSMAEQQFNQRAQRAQAQDLINRFNVQNINDARLRNLQARQEVQMGNVDARNAAQYHNKALPIETYNMRSQNSQLAGGATSRAAQIAANARESRLQRKSSQTAGMIQGAGTLIGGVAGFFGSGGNPMGAMGGAAAGNKIGGAVSGAA